MQWAILSNTMQTGLNQHQISCSKTTMEILEQDMKYIQVTNNNTRTEQI